MEKAISTTRWRALLAVALLQAAVLGWMVWDRASLISQGREILLATDPVDPRSLFRGDYVILNYALANAALPAGAPVARAGDRIHVTLAKGTDGLWSMTALAAEQPTALGADRVAMRGRIESVWPDGDKQQLRLAFGIESYFVAEGEGRDLEKLVGTESLAVVVAVADDGRAAIKGLRIGDQVRYDEPLY